MTDLKKKCHSTQWTGIVQLFSITILQDLSDYFCIIQAELPQVKLDLFFELAGYEKMARFSFVPCVIFFRIRLSK